MKCPNCGSENLRNKGYGSKDVKKKYQCKDCKRYFSIELTSPPIIEPKEKVKYEKVIIEKDQEIEFLKKQISHFSDNNRIKSVKINSDNCLKFGIIADTHFGSLYEQSDLLKSFYDFAKDEKVNIMLHAGDILDGHGIYKGQEFEQYARGNEEQLNAFSEKIPKNGIKTYFITGNHDGSFKKIAGVCVGKQIAEKNSDWIFCGEDFASLDLTTNNGANFKIQLVHPSGGTAYAISYRTQKIIEAYTGGEKPNCVIIGHYHKAEHLPCYRNVQAIQAGTFQSQTPFMKSKAIAAHIGGWIIEVAFGVDKAVNRFKAEFIAFYS